MPDNDAKILFIPKYLGFKSVIYFVGTDKSKVSSGNKQTIC